MDGIKNNFVNSFYRNTILKSDWKLLVFLLLFMDVKLVIKLIAIIFIFATNRNFRFDYKLRQSRLPWFYLFAIAIACINLFVAKKFLNINYDIVFLVGISFWLICIPVSHQLKLFTETLDQEIICNTLILFFIINAIASFANLLFIVIETGTLNPYLYQGMYQKYFIGTGDHIRGISFDTSTTNALLNAFGVFYFLRKNKFPMVILCMCVLLLTGSNLTNLLTIVSLLFIFIFQSTRDQKSIIAICLFMFVIFIAKISPQNNEYAAAILKKITAQKEQGVSAAIIIPSPTIDEQNQKTAQQHLDLKYSALQKNGLLNAVIANAAPAKPFIPMPNINAPEYQNRNDTTQLRNKLIAYSKEHHQDSIFNLVKDGWLKKIGKIVSMQQTMAFMYEHPNKIITGNGMGCFSSKLAFRATALDVSGNYPEKLSYVNDDFSKNHLAVFLYYFTKQKELHSVTNTPDSVYNQLAGEYGLAGVLAFLFFYIGFFIKRCNIREMFPILFVMTSAFAFGYWFEQLSIVPFFELMMFINIKRPGLTTA